MQVTNLAAVKDIANALLFLEIKITELSPIVVDHPIYESGFAYMPKTKKIVNILEDADDLNEIRNYYCQLIEKATTAKDVYYLFRTPYKLAFFKFVNRYLSQEDYAQLLADAWIQSENPNQDINVSLKQAIGYFRKANKRNLMNEKDYKLYEELPETMTVYRGVAYGRNPKGLSWTRNLDTAIWFANRFSRGDKKGYVSVATVSKNDVLAYFNSANEDELVIDVYKISNITTLNNESI